MKKTVPSHADNRAAPPRLYSITSKRLSFVASFAPGFFSFGENIMNKFAVLASFLFAGLTFSALAQENYNNILYSEEAGWPVYKQLAISPEDPDSCYTYHEVSATDYIYFLFVEGEATLMIQRDDWQLPANTTYPVFIQIDNNDPIETTIYTLDTSDAVMIDDDITPILDEIKAGGQLFLHTETTTYQYDLGGTARAISSAQACLSEITNPAPVNPFLSGQAREASNPFEAPPAEESQSYLLIPFLPIDSFETLFIDITDIGLPVEVEPSTYFGSYQALVGEAVYTFYWEEDSSTRNINTVFADVFPLFNESCKDMATTKLAEEIRGNHAFHQGSIACSNEGEEISLFFRLSVFNWADIDTAMIFLSTGGLEDREAIEIIDDLLVDNVTLVFESLDEE